MAQSFDSRFAAAESMCSFFGIVGKHAKSENNLTSLIALYDALNDDDDEVRIVASRAASGIFGQALIPPEAAVNLLSWMNTVFGASPLFKSLVVERIIAGCPADDEGCDPWAPAAEQLEIALQDDDSLFQQEKQNLFRDDVRETVRWISVIQSLEWSAQDDTIAAWDTWLQGGLKRVLSLVSDKPDVPLGWANNQNALIVCGRIVHSTMCIIGKCAASAELVALWEDVTRAVGTSASGSMAFTWLRMAIGDEDMDDAGISAILAKTGSDLELQKG